MAKFDGTSIETLEYDLTAFRKDPDAPGAWSGTIPEPTEDQVRDFFARLSDLSLRAVQEDDDILTRQHAESVARWREAHPDKATEPDPDRAAIAEWESTGNVRANIAELEKARAARRHGLRDEYGQVIADLCSETPGTDVLGALQWRPLQHFLGWISGQFSPEALAAAMNA